MTSDDCGGGLLAPLPYALARPCSAFGVAAPRP